jgi:hypothetical protein
MIHSIFALINEIGKQLTCIGEKINHHCGFYVAAIKAANEVEEPWDSYNILRTIPAEDAAQPLSRSRCPLITQSN